MVSDQHSTRNGARPCISLQYANNRPWNRFPKAELTQLATRERDDSVQSWLAKSDTRRCDLRYSGSLQLGQIFELSAADPF